MPTHPTRRKESHQCLRSLTCSRFFNAREKLWLEHNRADLILVDDPSLYRRAADGNLVGEKARMQFGADVIWPPAGEDKAVAATKARALLVASAGKPADEVPMCHAGLYARADALISEGGGCVPRETKASSFPLKKDRVTPDDPKEHHVNDLAIQAWVIIGKGKSHEFEGISFEY